MKVTPKTPAPPLRLYEMSEVAAMLGLSYAGVRARVLRGALRVFAVTGRGGKLFRREDVEGQSMSRRRIG